jgi:hypothetical protein
MRAPKEKGEAVAKLTAAERAKLPSRSFALPEKREYPIHDIEHAQLALRLMTHESEATQARIRAAVHRRYPQIEIEGERESVRRSLDTSKERR